MSHLQRLGNLAENLILNCFRLDDEGHTRRTLNATPPSDNASNVESLQYQGPPELVDLDGFRGFKLEEEGQSSKQVLDVYCNICMEHKFSSECMAIEGCGHAYCTSCMSQYVTAKVAANDALIVCPEPRCKAGLLQPEMCRLIISPEVFNRWGTILCEEGIVGPTKLYCPYNDCSILLINEGGKDGRAIVESQCPHCRRNFCAKCIVPWHSELTCNEYQKLEPNRENMMFMKLADRKKWQKCPKCGFFVEKNHGCNHIKCRCRQSFCYKCGAPLTNYHRCFEDTSLGDELFKAFINRR